MGVLPLCFPQAGRGSRWGSRRTHLDARERLAHAAGLALAVLGQQVGGHLRVAARRHRAALSGYGMSCMAVGMRSNGMHWQTPRPTWLVSVICAGRRGASRHPGGQVSRRPAGASLQASPSASQSLPCGSAWPSLYPPCNGPSNRRRAPQSLPAPGRQTWTPGRAAWPPAAARPPTGCSAAAGPCPAPQTTESGCLAAAMVGGQGSVGQGRAAAPAQACNTDRVSRAAAGGTFG